MKWRSHKAAYVLGARGLLMLERLQMRVQSGRLWGWESGDPCFTSALILLGVVSFLNRCFQYSALDPKQQHAGSSCFHLTFRSSIRLHQSLLLLSSFKELPVHDLMPHVYIFVEIMTKQLLVKSWFTTNWL